MQIKEGLEIKTYEDYQEHKHEIFDIIEETIDLAMKDFQKKNASYLWEEFLKEMSNIKNI